MFLYAGNNLNKWMEGATGSTERRSTLFLMGGEMPASMEELRGKFAHTLLHEAIATLELTSRASGRFTHYIHKRAMRNPHGFGGNRMGAISAIWMGNRVGYEDQPISPEFYGSNHYTRLLSDFGADAKNTECNYGSNSGSYYEMCFKMEKPVHVNKLFCYWTFTSSSSSFYGNYFAGREIATDYRQVDSTLDLSAATEGQRVRIMNREDLPAALSHIVVHDNGVVCEFKEGVWTSLGMHDSYEWVKMNKDRIQLSSRELEYEFDDVDYVASKEKFDTFKFKADSSSSVNFRGRYMVFGVEDNDLPTYADLPPQTITWGIMIPQYDDLSSIVTYKSLVSGDAPMFMMDVGVPNSGAAATVNHAVDVTHESNITLMNLKIAVNWMEELA